MPLFDITSGIKANYTSGAMPQDAYDIMKKIVVQFSKRGYQVAWVEQRPPERVVAKLTDKDGTDLKAEIDVVDAGTVTRCDINIHGHVFLGGILGRLVSASTIQGRAGDKIKEMLDENFAGQPSKRAPIKPAAAAAPPKPAGPSTLPPGHPGAAKAAAAAAAAPAPAPAPKPAPPPAAAAAAPAPAPAVVTAAPQPAPVAVAAPEPTFIPHTSSTPSASSAPPTTTDETWQALSDRVMAGASVEARVVIMRASSAAGALGDATLIQFVQIGLVQALARTRGKKLDRGAASSWLSKVAPPSSQTEMAQASSSKQQSTTAAYALTAAVGEAALQGFDDSTPEEALKDVFAGAFERIRGEKTAALSNGSSPVADRLEQVQEAYDADLISEGEMLLLKERVLATL